MSQVFKTLDHSDWSGTETLVASFTAQDIVESAFSGVRVIYDNGLDIDVTVTVKLTDDRDANNNRTSTGVSGRSVAAGAFKDDLLTEPYSKVVVEVTPAATPSSGQVELVIDG